METNKNTVLENTELNEVVKNIINLGNAVCTNNDFDPKYRHKYEVFRFDNATEYTKIKTHIDNLVNTFGIDIVKAVIMADLSLMEKSKLEETEIITVNEQTG